MPQRVRQLFDQNQTRHVRRLDKNAPQLIQGNDSTCFAHFVSTPPSGTPGINGGAALDANGAFTGAKLYLGSTQRTPCEGTTTRSRR